MVYPIEDEKYLLDDIWLHSVKLYEFMSESMPQLALNLWVIKIYGISDPIQLLSFFLAWFGLIKIQADRYCFIRNSEDLGIGSWNFVKSFLDVSIPVSSAFICFLLCLSEDCMPAWFLLIASLAAHPIQRWIGPLCQKFTFKKAKDIASPNAKSTSRHSTIQLNVKMIVSIPIAYIVLTVSKKR